MTTKQNETSQPTAVKPQTRKENRMKTKIRHAAMATVAATLMATGTPAWAATNTATDPGGGGVTLTTSGLVTVNSSSLQLVKQVWNGTGTTCLASQPADATCNSSATSVTVPAGVQFLIFVKNTSDVALTDVRFQDVLDTSGTGFTYTATSIKRTPNDATAPLDTDTAATIHAAAVTAQTDAVGAPDDYASYNAGTLTVGAVTGQANMSLGFPAHKSFGVVFSVTKK
jgi:uncharacterized repeat protein (TIGR01451 family)